jgi:hypothetical protein
MAQLRPIDCILIGRRTALPGGVTPGEPQAGLGDQLVDPLLDPFICVHSGMRLAEAAGPNCIETPNSDGTVLVMNLGLPSELPHQFATAVACKSSGTETIEPPTGIGLPRRVRLPPDPTFGGRRACCRFHSAPTR